MTGARVNLNKFELIQNNASRILLLVGRLTPMAEMHAPLNPMYLEDRR